MWAQSSTFSSDLPRYLTRFIGREGELARLKQLATTRLAPPLITLTGVGGCGKTRLAVEAVRAFADQGEQRSRTRFGDGVRWVSLSSLNDPALLPQTVAAALGLREASGPNPTPALLAALRGAQLLLVLDNCEHLASASGKLVQSLLAACPHLVILATSRAPLNVAGESIFPVPPLKTADSSAAGSEAVRLFLDRATMMLSGYAIHPGNAPAINELCRRLDGLPLAIELAASWIRVLSAQDILQHVEESLDFLASSQPALAPRHRSMRAVLDTSWRCLSEDQQRVFAALSLFRGSFSREAAEGVAGASLSSLTALAENSLLSRLPGEEEGTRYQLHEVVRQYAGDRLETYDDGSAARARQQHLRFFLALAEQAAQTWDTDEETAWLRRLRVEQDNLRAAVRRAIVQGQGEEALRLSAALFTFWIYTTPPQEYYELLQSALALPWETASPAVTLARAKAVNVAGYAAVAVSDFIGALACFEEGLGLYTRLDDCRGISWSLRGCGFATLLGGQVEEAQPFVEQSLALSRRCDDAWGEVWALFDLGHIAFAQGAIERAQPLLEEALERFLAVGTLFGAYRALILLGDIQRRCARWAEALAHYAEALQLEQENRFGQFGADLLEGLARIAAVQRQPQITARLCGAGHAWRQIFAQARWFFYEPGYKRMQDMARAQLTDDKWAASYDAGCGLTAEQAMGEARQAIETLATAVPVPPPAGLTEREVEVLCLLAQGLKDQEIAERLVVSPRTVHAHLRSIFSKLEVSTRTAAAHKAMQLNLV